MSKNEIKEILHTEINDIVYQGYRVITGIRVQYQTIHYKDIFEKDSTRYTKDRKNSMDFKAQQILWELVKRYHKL